MSGSALLSVCVCVWRIHHELIKATNMGLHASIHVCQSEYILVSS